MRLFGGPCERHSGLRQCQACVRVTLFACLALWAMQRSGSAWITAGHEGSPDCSQVGRCHSTSVLRRARPARTVDYDELNSILVRTAEAVGRGDLPTAKHLFTKFEWAGGMSDVRIFNLITKAARVGEHESVEPWINQMLDNYVAIPNGQKSVDFENRNSTASGQRAGYDCVMADAAEKGNLNVVAHWYDKMLQAGLSPGRITFKSLMNAAATSGSLAAAEHWSAKMQAAGFPADTISINTLLEAAKREENLGAAEMWFERMLAEGVCPDKFTFGNLVTTAAVAQDEVAALRWIHEGETRGALPVYHAFESVMNMYSKMGASAKAERFIMRMRTLGLPVSKKVFKFA